MTETTEETMARLQRNNDWLTAQLAAAQKTLALKHLPLPTEDEDLGDDPNYWSYAGLVAKYCAVLDKNAALVDSHTGLLKRLYMKGISMGARFTVSEITLADAISMADRRIRSLKARIAELESAAGSEK